MRLLVPPPIQALLVAALIWFCSKLFPPLDFSFTLQSQLVILLAVAGVIIDFSSIRLFVKAETTVNPLDPSKSGKLVTNGIYNYTRNPMYVGMVLFLTAFGIWIGNLVFVPLVVLFICYITVFQIKPEEEALTKKFGEQYTDYCRRVRRWI